jgi:hypothetical protein
MAETLLQDPTYNKKTSQKPYINIQSSVQLMNVKILNC